MNRKGINDVLLYIHQNGVQYVPAVERHLGVVNDIDLRNRVTTKFNSMRMNYVARYQEDGRKSSNAQGDSEGTGPAANDPDREEVVVSEIRQSQRNSLVSRARSVSLLSCRSYNYERNLL